MSPPSTRERDYNYNIISAVVTAYVCADVFPGYMHHEEQIPLPTLSETEVTCLVHRGMQAGEGVHEGARGALWWVAEAGIDCDETFNAITWVMRNEDFRLQQYPWCPRMARSDLPHG